VAVTIDVDLGVAALSARGAAWAIAVPVAVYLTSVWLLLRRPDQAEKRIWAFPVAAVLVLAAPLGPAPLVVVAVLVALLVVVT
ncbi:MAG TPA: low temperature requirement protein A, partial [Micromonosporaceae bacterium]|nr:low temperature requirement protein A [Micromonosporaceae bacterium]